MKSQWIFGAVVTLFLSAGCNPSITLPVPSSHETQFVDPELQLAFNHPSAWEQVEPLGNKIVGKVQDPDTGFSFHIFVKDVGSTSSLFPEEAVASLTPEKIEQMLANSLPDAELIRVWDTFISGKKAVAYLSHSPSDPEAGVLGMDAMWFITVQKSRMFMGTCYGSSDQWVDLEPLCEGVFSSVTFF